MSQREAHCVKCVMIGDGGVGKTCMTLSYAQTEFPSGYNSTLFDTYAVELRIDEEPYTLGIFDTAGQESYEKLRAFAYDQSEVVVICFSLVNPASLANVRTVWLPELKHYARKRRPLILVGTQTDLRDTGSELKAGHVSRDQGEAVAEDIGAVCYLECSALTQEGLQAVFEEILTSAIDLRKRKMGSRIRVLVRRLSDRIKRRKSR